MHTGQALQIFNQPTQGMCVRSGTHILASTQNVQNFALRVCCKSWSCDYATLPGTLNMQSLSDSSDSLYEVVSVVQYH